MDDRTPQDVAAEDAAVARLRAADPGAGVVPDTVALRSAVDERRAAPDVRADVPDELAARRARRWTGWPAKIAGVAAAALVVGGGGGYAIGAAGDSPAPAAAAAISLQAPGEGMAPTAAQDGAAPESLMAAGDASRSYWPGMYGRTVFTASGLSDAGTVAHAWALDAAQSFNEQTIAAAAAALGVAGTPVLADGWWTVGPNDGTAATVQLYADGTGSLSYWDPAKDTWACATVSTEELSKSEADPSVGIAPEPDPCTQRDLGPAPQGDAATNQLRDILTALGVDPAGFELVAEEYGDPLMSYVTAYGVLDGQRTGLTWSATLTGAGVQSLYGSTAPLVDLGEYQVISPVEAVQRLSDPRFGSSGGWYGPLMADAGIAVDGTAAAPMELPTVPPTATAGSAISWPVDQATIVQARLGVAIQTQVNGSALLVPTYELTSDDGGIWTVIAVADSHLDFSTGQ